jgi:hypothetical protein
MPSSGTTTVAATAQKCCSRSTPHHHHRQTRCRSSPHDIVQLVPHLTTLADVHLASSLPVLADLQAGAFATASAPADVPATVSTTTYTPGPVEVGWQIWFAAIVSTVPFVIGAYEFGKRIVSVPGPAWLSVGSAQTWIFGLLETWCFVPAMLTLFAFSRSCHMCVLVVLQLIQRRCKVCGGNGLVQRGKYQRKCPGKHVQQGTGGSQAVLWIVRVTRHRDQHSRLLQFSPSIATVGSSPDSAAYGFPGVADTATAVAECGGFFPWISWSMFLSANARPGNGGENRGLQATAGRLPSCRCTLLLALRAIGVCL